MSSADEWYVRVSDTVQQIHSGSLASCIAVVVHHRTNGDRPNAITAQHGAGGLAIVPRLWEGTSNNGNTRALFMSSSAVYEQDDLEEKVSDYLKEIGRSNI